MGRGADNLLESIFTETVFLAIESLPDAVGADHQDLLVINSTGAFLKLTVLGDTQRQSAAAELAKRTGRDMVDHRWNRLKPNPAKAELKIKS